MTIDERLKYLNTKIEEHDKAFAITSPLPLSTVYNFLAPVSIKTTDVQNRFVRTSAQNRFVRLITTKLNSRVMLPEFGSQLSELIDKSVDDEYKLKFRHYIADAFYNNKTSKPWDNELIPEEIKVKNITNDGTLEVNVKMRNGAVYGYRQQS